jgi:hypothetical protein
MPLCMYTIVYVHFLSLDLHEWSVSHLGFACFYISDSTSTQTQCVLVNECCVLPLSNSNCCLATLVIILSIVVVALVIGLSVELHKDQPLTPNGWCDALH